MGDLERLIHRVVLRALRKAVARGDDVGVTRNRRTTCDQMAPDVGVAAAIGGFGVLTRQSGVSTGAPHEPTGEQIDESTVAIRTVPRIGSPVPVMQRQRRVDLPQQALELIADDAMPGQKRRPDVDILAGGMSVLVDVLL